MQPARSAQSASDRGQERRLVARVLNGDGAAGRELYDAHAARIFRLVFRLAGEEELARDLTQETFIRAFNRLSDFRGEASLSTWLHSIAVSVTLNGLRKQRRHRTREIDISEALDVGHTPQGLEPDLRSSMYRAIDDLSEIYRLVLVMHDVEGYTHNEIAGILGIPEGTSKARLSVARSKVRDALAHFVKEH